MRRASRLAVTAAIVSLPVVAHSVALAQTEPVDREMLQKIRDEGLQRSQAMDHISWLADVYGPRLTGSPTMDQAAEWAMSRMQQWGLSNVHRERFEFGKGWSLERFSAHMLEPQVQPITGMPKSWTTGTGGPVTAEVILAPIESEADFAKYRGKLRGRIVLTQPQREVRMLEGRLVLRMNEEEIQEALTDPAAARAGGAGRAGAPAGGGRGGRGSAGPSLRERTAEFYRAEGAIALIDRGSDNDESAGGSNLSWRTQRTDGGTVFVGSGGSRDESAGSELPSITIAVEHYNRMVRILERDVRVTMELDVRTRFYDETEPRGYNIVAEIPGTDPALRDQVVMLGAHFDSHHGGTGATDNASGSAAMLEAMRILQAVGARPRRTIRIALWGAEEQGLIGSREYVTTHFGDAESPKPDHSRLSAYYNIDNGTGRIRGIWMEQNSAVRPIFAQWIAPLKDLGVELLGPRAVGSTDHASFDRAGLPGFQFIQERLEYNSRTHHSTMDVVDRVQEEDVTQMAVVAAWFAWMTAQRDEPLPRKPAL